MTMTEGMKAYQSFVSLKLHFNSDYDYFKYSGKTRRIDESKITLRRDFHHFRRIERRYKDDITSFFVANLIAPKPIQWIGELATIDAEKNYKEWRKRQESFRYMLRQELASIVDSDAEFPGKHLFTPTNGSHPKFLQHYLNNKISLETVIATDAVIEFSEKWNQTIQDPVVWPDVYKRMKKYRPFLKFEPSEVKKILYEVLM